MRGVTSKLGQRAEQDELRSRMCAVSMTHDKIAAKLPWEISSLAVPHPRPELPGPSRSARDGNHG
ncbi:hypothetical protein FDG2_4085 [Candidatus Protofrankia californiensis]|uniref:Uncharacterized protein n=1 Tax=Candidatus Protofrankia californiensis TaxID=1839754 RepID=A0A1C3P363_9ACTN|nr:hypothetical protein FDG2_4085 [Candidatus Protofrankia californiensis]